MMVTSNIDFMKRIFSNITQSQIRHKNCVSDATSKAPMDLILDIKVASLIYIHTTSVT